MMSRQMKIEQVGHVTDRNSHTNRTMPKEAVQ